MRLLFLKICRECFYEVFEEEIHQVIVDNQLFKPGERIAIGASGGKGVYTNILYASSFLLEFCPSVPPNPLFFSTILELKRKGRQGKVKKFVCESLESKAYEPGWARMLVWTLFVIENWNVVVGRAICMKILSHVIC